MAATSAQMYPDSGNQTRLRAWAGTLSDGIVAAGMVRTSDTGQTQGGSLLYSSSQGALLGYEVFRMADTLQATSPLFLRVEYRHASTSSSIPYVVVAAGTATDGAGNLTSAVGSPLSVATTTPCLTNSSSYAWTNPTVQTQLMAVNGDGSTVVASLFITPSSGNSGGGFLLERTRDGDGTPNSRGFLLMGWFGSSGSNQMTSQVVIYNYQLIQSSQTTVQPVPNGAPTSVLDGMTVYPVPVFTGYTPRLNGPSKYLALAGTGDLPFGTTYQLTLYGETATWMSYGPGYGFNGYSNAGLRSPQVRIS